MPDRSVAARVPTGRLPGALQRALRELEGGQTESTRVASAVPLLRRIEVGELVYLPEVGRGRTPPQVMSGFLVPLGFVALVFAILAWLVAEGPWFLAMLGTFVGCMTVGVVLLFVELALRRRRRLGVARYGLVFTPQALLLWGPRWSRVVPREAAIRPVAERRGSRSRGYRECLVVRTTGGEENWVLHPRQSPALRQALGRWQRDERPWVTSEVLGPARGGPPLPP